MTRREAIGYISCGALAAIGIKMQQPTPKSYYSIEHIESKERWWMDDDGKWVSCKGPDTRLVRKELG